MTRKLVNALVVAVTLAVSGGAFADSAKAPPKKEAPQVSYVCPMHPDVKQATPGKCPKCGMDLVKDEPKK
jgi:uncharacterized low-complexity protein